MGLFSPPMFIDEKPARSRPPLPPFFSRVSETPFVTAFERSHAQRNYVESESAQIKLPCEFHAEMTLQKLPSVIYNEGDTRAVREKSTDRLIFEWIFKVMGQSEHTCRHTR